MMVRTTTRAGAPGNSYRMVSPLVSHHHYNARGRPGRGQPAAVWLTRKALYNPWDRQARGLGALTYEEARDILMYGAQRGHTDEEIAEARLVVYPARTEAGQLVSASQIATGRFEMTADPEAGERPVAVRTTAGGAIPPIPTLVRPDLYTDFEDCIPGDQDCMDRNAARERANHALLTNAGNDLMRAKCKRNCALNTQAGHPEHCLNCAVLFARVPVPPAPGTRHPVSRGAPLPTAPAPSRTSAVAPAPSPAAAVRPGAAATWADPETMIGAAERSARAATAATATWMKESMVGGIPNWLLIVGVAGAGLLLLGKEKGR